MIAQKRLSALDKSLYDHIRPSINTIAMQPGGPLSARMTPKGKMYLETIFKKLHLFVNTALEVFEQNPAVPSLWGVMSQQEGLTPASVSEILELIPAIPEVLQTPVYSTVVQILPLIQRSMSQWYTEEIDRATQEQYLVIWMTTMKMIESATQSDLSITHVTIDEVALAHQAFQYQSMSMVTEEYIFDQRIQSEEANWYENIQLSVNSAINGINRDAGWRTKVAQLQDLNTALQAASFMSLSETLDQLNQISGSIVELVWNTGRLVAAGLAVGLGTYGVYKGSRWMRRPGSPPTESDHESYVGTDFQEELSGAPSYWLCTCGERVLSTDNEQKHLNGYIHRRNLKTSEEPEEPEEPADYGHSPTTGRRAHTELRGLFGDDRTATRSSTRW